MWCPWVKRRPKKLNQPWMTKALSVSRKEKLKLAAVKHYSDTHLRKYQKFRNTYNSLIRKAKHDSLEELILKNTNNSKKIWQGLNEFTNRVKIKEQLPSYFNINDTQTRGESKIADNFNQFYSQIGTTLMEQLPKPNNSHLSYLPDRQFPKLQLQEVKFIDLLQVVTELKPKTSAGYDNCSNKILKKIFRNISEPLLHLINHAIRSETFPHEWKVAKIIPVFKKGDKHEMTNYRPVSLLPTVSKIIEKLLIIQLERHIKENDIMYPLQFGFRKGHETSHALLTLVDRIHEADNDPNLAVMLDIKKAFDCIDFNILLDKLDYYGIPTKIFKSYLIERKQYVQINETKSDFEPIKCGVPQGSNLGPLFFKLYINDLPSSTDFTTVLFADDTTLHIKAENEQKLIEKVNIELEKIGEWFSANKFTLHPDKTRFMVFSGDRSKFSDKINLQNKTLIRIGNETNETHFRFVGVEIDEKLNFKEHTDYICKKMAKGAFLLNKNKNFLPLKLRMLLYNALIKPHMEYGIIVWGNLPKYLQSRISAIQNRAIRAISKVKNHRCHTTTLFAALNVLKFNDLYQINCYKIAFKAKHGALPEPLQQYFIVKDPTRTRNKKYDMKLLNKNKHPMAKIIELWNSLEATDQLGVILDFFIKYLKSRIICEYNNQTCKIKNCLGCMTWTTNP